MVPTRPLSTGLALHVGLLPYLGTDLEREWDGPGVLEAGMWGPGGSGGWDPGASLETGWDPVDQVPSSSHWPAHPPTEDRAFHVRIAGDAPLQGVLGGALTIPCHVHYLRPLPGHRAVLGSPRVKWTFLSGGREAEVLVARGLRVKVSEAYRFRVALPAYPASLTDVSLVLSELRPNDSGIYRCEVQHGIDDSSDAVEVKVKGEGQDPGRFPQGGSPQCEGGANALEGTQ